MPAVAGKERASGDDEQRPDDGKPDHEVPRRLGVAERVGEVVPEPVLDVVDQREEERRDERRGDPDPCPEQHEVEVGAAVHQRRRRAGAAGGGVVLRWG